MTQYVKILNGSVEKFPYTVSDLYAENPYTKYDSDDFISIFPDTEEALVRGCQLAEVQVLDVPTYDDKTQYVQQWPAPQLKSNVWTLGYDVLSKSAEEIAAEKTSAWARLRADRKAKLSACDWTQLPDAPLTNIEMADWAQYRQVLRDLPANTTDPFNPTWPQEP